MTADGSESGPVRLHLHAIQAVCSEFDINQETLIEQQRMVFKITIYTYMTLLYTNACSLVLHIYMYCTYNQPSLQSAR